MFYTINIKSSFVRCLIVGGGEVALRKLKGSLESDIYPVIISPQLHSSVNDLVIENKLNWISKTYETYDISGFNMVFAATDNELLNNAIADESHKAGILCDNVSEGSTSSFHTPAVIRRGDFSLSVSTAGKVPFLTHRLKQQYEQSLSPEINTKIEVLQKCRESIILRAKGNDELKRQLFETELEPLVRDFLKLF